jgi:hypothetical protein
MDRQFATLADLPIDQAAHYSGRVRIAYVSYIPPSKRGRMAALQGGRSVDGPDAQGVSKRVLSSGAEVVRLAPAQEQEAAPSWSSPLDSLPGWPSSHG